MVNIDNILSKLTLDEKCALCSGINMWNTTPIASQNIPSIVMTDGPHGLRKEMVDVKVANIMQVSQKSTCFPTAVTLASSWDRSLAEKVAEAIGEEAIDQGVDVVLGPGVNIKRNPLCGRNFEYFSEDPFLAGELGASYVQGMQKKNVGTSLKHYAVNSQEYRRMTLSSEVDERTLREIYLPAFENTVKKSQPYTVMCSYNPINGEHASDNKRLLTDILREEWGFDGLVVSDWGAVNNRVKGIVAGMDLQMPSDEGLADREIAEAVREGKLSEADLDKVARRILELIDKCLENRKKNGEKKADYQKNFLLAEEAAVKGAVLMKNENGLLPLKKEEKLVVIGNLAKTMRYQGSGSSQINPFKLKSFTDCLDDVKAEYIFSEGYHDDCDSTDKKLLEDARDTAKDADVVILFVGLNNSYESEGFDRRHIMLPVSHLDLINAVTQQNKKVIVVLSGGSPIDMSWIDSVPAVLNMYLAGCAGGSACYKLLFGDANPSGKLAETFPLDMKDNPAYLYYQMGPQTVEYRESIYVGYRYFDTAKKSVRFPFGFGLSYSEFAYSDLKLSALELTDSENLKVSFKVKNVGKCGGEEIAQLYVRDVESTIFREDKGLKGFEKVHLEPGEEQEISIVLDKRSFAFYNVLEKDWTVESGVFEILVGASSRDIRLRGSVQVNAPVCKIPDYRTTAPCYYDCAGMTDVPVKAFEVLLGRETVDNAPLKKGQIDYNSTVADIAINWIGKAIKNILYANSARVLPKGSPEHMKKMIRLSLLDIPMRNAIAMTSGIVPKKSIDGLIIRCNKGVFRGTGKIIGGFIGKRASKKAEIYKPL